MCGRYWLEIMDPEVEEILVESGITQTIRNGELCPGSLAPVWDGTGLSAMQWGYGQHNKRPIINARMESAAEKPIFRDGLQGGRCLIPASWYFEWERAGTQRVKYRIRPKEPGLMWMAGLCRPSLCGGREFVILTRDAPTGIRFIHDRMPVILPANVQKPWLSGDLSVLSAAIDHLSALPEDGQMPSLFGDFAFPS